MNSKKHFICFTLIQIILIAGGTSSCVFGQSVFGLINAPVLNEAEPGFHPLARPSSDQRIQVANASTQDQTESQPSPSDEAILALEAADDESARDKLLIDESLDDTDDIVKKTLRPDFGPWPRKGIRAISIDVRETNAEAPKDRSGQLLSSAPTAHWTEFNPTPKVFAWAAPDIRYQPLYFEDVALERYGQTAGLHRQPYASAIHMFKSLVLLPNQMHHDAPGSCDYPLGFCRPGNDVPYTIQRQYFGHPNRK